MLVSLFSRAFLIIIIIINFIYVSGYLAYMLKGTHFNENKHRNKMLKVINIVV